MGILSATESEPKPLPCVAVCGFLFLFLSLTRYCFNQQNNYPRPNPPNFRMLANDLADFFWFIFSLVLQYNLPYSSKSKDPDILDYSGSYFLYEFGVILVISVVSFVVFLRIRPFYDYGVLDFCCAMWVQFAVCNYQHKHYCFSVCGVLLSSACVVLKNRFNQWFLGENEDQPADEAA